VINIDMRSFSFSDSYMRAINEKVTQEQLRRIELERTKADKWDGKLPEANYAGAPIPFLNVSK
jgi:hypothetical protein